MDDGAGTPHSHKGAVARGHSIQCFSCSRVYSGTVVDDTVVGRTVVTTVVGTVVVVGGTVESVVPSPPPPLQAIRLISRKPKTRDTRFASNANIHHL